MMSILAELLTDLVIGSAAGIAETGNFYVLTVLGTLVIFGSIFLLNYQYSLPEPSVDQYERNQITYSAVRYKRDKDNKEIVLHSPGQKYSISEQLWKGQDPENLVQELQRSNQADVWLSEASSTDIKGLRTDTVFIDPDQGASYDKGDQNAGVWLGWFFIFDGLLLIVLASYERSKAGKVG